MLRSTVTDVALVFEGGGMRASYSSGVLAALLEAGVFCDWVGGISAGSSCTANYLARDGARARRSFVDFASEPDFGDWRTFLQGKGMFNAEWIYEHTSAPDEVLPYDYSTFEANPARFRIGGLRCRDGQMFYWGRDDVPDRAALMKRVRASSTMPLLMPWTSIEGEDYCDGALGPSGGIALDAARADGFGRFLVVLTRERGYRKPAARLPRVHRALLHRYPAVADALLERPANYNRTLDELLELEEAGAAYVIAPSWMPIGNSERDTGKLQAMYDAGYGQARREMGQILDFVGLAASPA
ncbi:MAG: patatin family protein [Propionibacteriaceae bacterium]|nr:patatin family protein [Propionibacteriaceae bacterium]